MRFTCIATFGVYIRQRGCLFTNVAVTTLCHIHAKSETEIINILASPYFPCLQLRLDNKLNTGKSPATNTQTLTEKHSSARPLSETANMCIEYYEAFYCRHAAHILHNTKKYMETVRCREAEEGRLLTGSCFTGIDIIILRGREFNICGECKRKLDDAMEAELRGI
jgi:hypothetical protein